MQAKTIPAVLLAALLAALVLASPAAADTQSKPWVFMLAGQSNMEGRGGPIPTEHVDPRILRQGRVGKPWTVARDPLNGYQVGPGMSFAQELLRRHPHIRIVLVPCAKGGSTITMWQPGTLKLNRCIGRMRDAVRRGGIAKGILFAQGESDTYFHAEALQWPARYRNTIHAMRRGLSTPSLPVVHTVIATDSYPNLFPEWALIQQMQRGPLNGHDVAIETHDLPLSGDGMHFTVSSYRMLGRRFARAWEGLVQQLVRPGGTAHGR